jgi:hypothetical protein
MEGCVEGAENLLLLVRLSATYPISPTGRIGTEVGIRMVSHEYLVPSCYIRGHPAKIVPTRTGRH